MPARTSSLGRRHPRRPLTRIALCCALAASAQAQSTPQTIALDGQLGSALSVDSVPKPALEPFSLAEGLQLDGLLPTYSLPPLDMAFVRAQDEARASGFDKTLRYGIGRAFGLSFADGMLIRLADGSLLWAAEVELQEALGIRLHLVELALPRGAQLIVYSPDAPDELLGPYEGVGYLGDGQLWTPTRRGPRVRLECRFPDVKPGEDLRALGFEIDAAIHVYRNPVGGGDTGSGDSSEPSAGNCHNDVTCYSAGDNNKLAVAGIGFIDSDALFCTGALLNNFTGDFAPFWMTANHCLSTNATANSAEIYWRYETSTCNGSPPALSSVPQSAVCTLLSTGTASDYTLLRIDGAIPTGQLFWSGWNAGVPAVGTAGNCIHHPSGDYKRISFGTYSDLLECGGADHFRVNWSDGPTEPGSSGAPFYVNGFGFAGQLHCGPSDCGNETFDQYGSFHTTYPLVSGYFAAGAGDDNLEENDSCAAARPLGAGQYNDLIVKFVDQDWYRITIGTNERLSVNASFTDAFGDIDLMLYDACGGNLVAASSSTTDNEALTFANPGPPAHYYLQVYLWDEDVLNDYDLGLLLGPANDDCSDALAVGNGVFSGTLTGASNDGSAGCGGSSVLSPDVWYAYTASCSGELTVSTCGTNDGPGLDQGIDTVLSVRSSCGGLELACNDDDSPPIACSGLDAGALRDSAVRLPVSSGQSLIIRVANYNNGATGPFTLRISCAPGGPSAYCAPANPNSVSIGGAVLDSAGGYGSASATFNLASIPSQPGLLFAGNAQINAPFGCGDRCVGGFTIRGPVLNPSGNSLFDVPFDMSPAAAVFVQYWYRDPAYLPVCGFAFNLSNALQP